MYLTDTYTRPPGQCTICGSAFTPVIDTNIEDQYTHHQLYICHSCVQEMGRLLGTLEPVAVSVGLRAELDQASKEIERLTFANESLSRALEANYGLISTEKADVARKRAVWVSRRNGYDDAVRDMHKAAGTTPPAKPAELPQVPDYFHGMTDEELIQAFADNAVEADDIPDDVKVLVVADPEAELVLEPAPAKRKPGRPKKVQ